MYLCVFICECVNIFTFCLTIISVAVSPVCCRCWCCMCAYTVDRRRCSPNNGFCQTCFLIHEKKRRNNNTKKKTNSCHNLRMYVYAYTIHIIIEYTFYSFIFFPVFVFSYFFLFLLSTHSAMLHVSMISSAIFFSLVKMQFALNLYCVIN